MSDMHDASKHSGWIDQELAYTQALPVEDSMQEIELDAANKKKDKRSKWSCTSSTSMNKTAEHKATLFLHFCVAARYKEQLLK